MKSNFNTIEWDLNHSIWRNRPSGNYRSPMPLSRAIFTLFRKYPSAQSRRVSDNPHFSHAESWRVRNFSERLPLKVIHGELQFIDFSCLQQSSTRHFQSASRSCRVFERKTFAICDSSLWRLQISVLFSGVVIESSRRLDSMKNSKIFFFLSSSARVAICRCFSFND